MGKVINIDTVRQGKVKHLDESNARSVTFEGILEQNIQNMCESCDITPDEAIQTASDFYTKYWALIEHVRSPEFMLRK